MANDIDILLETENLTVTGGPQTLNVNLDFGAQGKRGGLILYGLDKPSAIPIGSFPQRPQILDWFINLNTLDDEYLYLYQYVNEDSVDYWKKIFKIIPNTYSTNEAVVFSAGVTTVNIEVSNSTLPLLGNAGIPKLNTHINLQTASGLPVASSFTLGNYSIINNNYVLPITITAAQLGQTGWAPLTGSATAHITINVI
jgi:hypothetical protein